MSLEQDLKEFKERHNEIPKVDILEAYFRKMWDETKIFAQDFENMTINDVDAINDIVEDIISDTSESDVSSFRQKIYLKRWRNFNAANNKDFIDWLKELRMGFQTDQTRAQEYLAKYVMRVLRGLLDTPKKSSVQGSVWKIAYSQLETFCNEGLEE